jgi:hypothetical protein
VVVRPTPLVGTGSNGTGPRDQVDQKMGWLSGAHIPNVTRLALPRVRLR